jgi:hypothetical protein
MYSVLHNSNTKKYKQIREWLVFGLATCGLLIGLLAVIAAMFAELGRTYVDPWVFWSSRLVWR